MRVAELEQAIRRPRCFHQPVPEPYRRSDLTELRRVLDARWPRLSREDERYWIGRWDRGVSPYTRVRLHAIRLQLDAIIALALHCGLRRSEIYGLTEPWMHYDNVGAVVWDDGTPWHGTYREVPYTDRCRRAVQDWLELRSRIGPDHESPWLNLWTSDAIREPLRPDAFNRMLRTYVGDDWSLRRLRDTCAVAWLSAGLPLEHVRRLLGLRSLTATLPYAALATGTLQSRMAKTAERFEQLTAPAQTT